MRKPPEKPNPAALAGAHRVEGIKKTIAAVSDSSHHTTGIVALQAARVLERWRISPPVARVVAELHWRAVA